MTASQEGKQLHKDLIYIRNEKLCLTPMPSLDTILFVLFNKRAIDFTLFCSAFLLSAEL